MNLFRLKFILPLLKLIVKKYIILLFVNESKLQ